MDIMLNGWCSIRRCLPLLGTPASSRQAALRLTDSFRTYGVTVARPKIARENILRAAGGVRQGDHSSMVSSCGGPGVARAFPTKGMLATSPALCRDKCVWPLSTRGAVHRRPGHDSPPPRPCSSPTRATSGSLFEHAPRPSTFALATGGTGCRAGCRRWTTA